MGEEGRVRLGMPQAPVLRPSRQEANETNSCKVRHAQNSGDQAASLLGTQRRVLVCTGAFIRHAHRQGLTTQTAQGSFLLGLHTGCPDLVTLKKLS